MKRIILLLPILYSTTYAMPVYADPISPEEKQFQLCSGTSAKDWGSQEEVEQQVIDLGYSLISVRIEKGCWEVKAFDPQKEVFEFYIHPVTKEIVMRKHKVDEPIPKPADKP